MDTRFNKKWKWTQIGKEVTKILITVTMSLCLRNQFKLFLRNNIFNMFKNRQMWKKVRQKWYMRNNKYKKSLWSKSLKWLLRKDILNMLKDRIIWKEIQQKWYLRINNCNKYLRNRGRRISKDKTTQLQNQTILKRVLSHLTSQRLITLVMMGKFTDILELKQIDINVDVNIAMISSKKV